MELTLSGLVLRRRYTHVQTMIPQIPVNKANKAIVHQLPNLRFANGSERHGTPNMIKTKLKRLKWANGDILIYFNVVLTTVKWYVSSFMKAKTYQVLQCTACRHFGWEVTRASYFLRKFYSLHCLCKRSDSPRWPENKHTKFAIPSLLNLDEYNFILWLHNTAWWQIGRASCRERV